MSYISTGGGGGGSSRTTVTGTVNYYVATTGSDVTGNGTIGNPWLTVQHAADYICNNLYAAPEDPTVFIAINVADGTYTTVSGLVLPECPFLNKNMVFIIGNLATPANVIFNTSNAQSSLGIVVSNQGLWYIQGVKFDASTDVSGTVTLVEGGYGELLFVQRCVFGKAGNAGLGYHVGNTCAAGVASTVTLEGPITVTDIAASFIFCKSESSTLATVYFQHFNLILSVDPGWPSGTISTDRFGVVYWNPDTGVTGTSSGPRYANGSEATILLGAGLDETSIPGVAGGSANSGYIIRSQGDFTVTDGTLSLGQSHGIPKTTGVVALNGLTSGTVNLSVQDAAGSWTMKLPTGTGSNGQVLSTDGSGNTSWIPAGAATITVNTSPIVGGTTGHVAYDNAGTFGEAANFLISSGNPIINTSGKYQATDTIVGAFNMAYSVPDGTAGVQYNVFLGGAGNGTCTGVANFGEGPGCLASLTSGSANMGEGSAAGGSLTSGTANVSIGAGALSQGATASHNMALGSNAGRNCTANDSVFIGDQSGLAVTSGGQSVYIGSACAVGAVDGFANTFIGYNAGGGIVHGQHNTFIGANISVAGDPSGTIILADGNGNIWLDYSYTNAFLVSTAANIGIKTGTFTIAGGLPAYLQTDGARIFVTDALNPVFAAPVVGGGTIHTPVYWDAVRAAWCCG